MKRSVFVLTVAVLMVMVAGTGLQADAKDPVAASASSEQIPGTFDREAYQMEQRILNNWLSSEQVALASERPIVVELSSKERARLEGECTDCVNKKLLVGMLKPVAAELAIDVHNPGLAAKAKLPGALQTTADGGLVWTAVVRSPGATALRLHLTGVSLPKGAELYVFNQYGEAHGPYTGAGKRGDGEVWTNTVAGEEITLQLRHWAAASTPKQWRNASLEIAEVDHLGPRYLVPMYNNLPGLEQDKSFCSYNASCVVDAKCYDSSDFAYIENLRMAVAHYQFASGGYTYICSGGLINDTDTSTTIPYFLTANHCLSTSTEAASMELYWQYWTSTCGGSCYNPSGSVPHTSGASIVHEDDTTDHTLLELDDSPPSGSVLMGWSATAVANSNGTALYRISHPQGAPQAYSRHAVDTSAGTCSGLARGNFIYSEDVIGATEGGSSGSIVVNSSGQIVGQLLGCCGTNCSNVCASSSNATVDGAFAAYFADVEDWLDPDSGGGTSELQNGVPVTGLSASTNQELNYYLSVPSGATNLVFQTTGSNGDADLYVKRGSAPTTSSYDCRSWSSSSNETCSFATPTSGTWYVMVRAYSAFTGLTLEGSYDDGGGGGAPCTSCDHYTGTLSSTGDYDYHPDGTYYYASSSGTHHGWLEGPTSADFDLYLRKWNGSSWVNVASSTSSSSDEEISYSGTSGYYTWRVYSYSGSGSYDLWLQTP